MDPSDKSGPQKDSPEDDMELCASSPRRQPEDVQVHPVVESFTERLFMDDVEGDVKGLSDSRADRPCQSQECCRLQKKESCSEEIHSHKSLVTEKIQSFSESVQTSLKLNERVDSSNDTLGPLGVKTESSELVVNEDDDLSDSSLKLEKELDDKAKNEEYSSIEDQGQILSEGSPAEIPAPDELKDQKEERNSSSETLPKDEEVLLSEMKSVEHSLYPNVVVEREGGREVEVMMKEIKKEVRIVEPSDSRKSSSAFVAERDITSILEDANAVLSQVAEPKFQAEPGDLRVAVVGAGPAGLCAARHLVGRGFKAEVFEQCPDIGGTWVYSEEPASQGHPLYPLHSSLYHDLWTNLPKEAMQFPDFTYPDEGTSYLPSEKILQYLISYADNYNLHPVIKVKHQVKRVAPVGKGWSITVEDLTTKTEDVSYFDAVMICSGPNNIPVYPNIEGIAKFSGKQIHSRDYRRAETYSGKRVLVVGLGPSGLDITYQLAKTAKQVILSHNKTKSPEIEFPKDVIVKPKVSSLFDKTVTFADGSTEEVDVVIYCTGYTYNFPFLTEDCGLIVDQYVGPLYKHLINIERPTMCIVGLPKYCPHQYMVDYQVRAYLNILLGESKIPTKEEMMADLEADMILRNSEGQRKKDYHKLGKGRTKQYMDDLAKLGNLDPVEPVMFLLFHDAFVRAIRDFKGFRNYVYKIVDKENYEVHSLDNKKE